MLPRHVAIIPDGNRRWARKNRKPLDYAYGKGIDHIGDVIKWCKKYRIKKLTMWGFSTENFMRDRKEVGKLFDLFDKKLEEGLRRDYKKYKVRVRFFGKLESLPAQIVEKIRKVENETGKNSKYEINILLAYGGRQELIDAVNSALEKKVGKVDEKTFAELLWTRDLQEPDLVIRTSGEIRTSGFLPWQTAYSEYYFSKKLWPDFSERDFRAALLDYSKRKRKYGR